MSDIPAGTDPAFLARRACAILLEGRDSEAVDLPADLAAVNVAQGSGVTSIHSRAWRGSTMDWLRYTEVVNDRGTFIMNLGAFPSLDTSLPVLQAEFVVLAGRLFHVVLDARSQDAGIWRGAGSSPESFLTSLRSRYPSLIQADDVPSWACEAMSSSVLWSHPKSAEAVAPAFACFAEFCAYFARMEEDSCAAVEPHAERWAAHRSERVARRSRIRASCIEGAPSRPFLQRLCGQDWAERFLGELLFPPFLGCNP